MIFSPLGISSNLAPEDGGLAMANEVLELNRRAPTNRSRRGARTGVTTIAPWILPIIVPVVVATDVLLMQRSDWGKAEKIALGTSFAWLLLVVVAIAASLRGKRRLFWGPLLAFHSVLVCLVVAEGSLRVAAGLRGPRLYEAGNQLFSVNKFGLRGTELPDESLFKIIAVGGSTTICGDLADEDVWTQRLMKELNRRGARVWVANAGVNGHTTAHHEAVLHLVPAIRHADMLIFLVGANDMLATLSANGGSTTEMLDSDAREFVRSMPWFRGPWTPEGECFLRGLRLFDLAKRASDSLVSRKHKILKEITFYAKMRDARAGYPTVAAPDLSTGLREYRQRLTRLVKECQNLSVRCVFLTQPSLWHQGMTAEENRLLWTAWVGPFTNRRGYLSPTDAAGAMREFNAALSGVCTEMNLECYDAAGAIPRNPRFFEDDLHMTPEGSRRLASFLGEHLDLRSAVPKKR
jgi:hypothetical protein